MQWTEEMETYLRESQEELKALVRDLCAIPAPSHHEEDRAVFCLRWFRENGGSDAFIDEAKNVICPLNVTENGPVRVFMAHMDTVFPDTEPMPLVETEEELRCPGVCDDTANLAVLMICARWCLRHRPRCDTGLVFAANSCEEGLGNLKGCRAICQRYGPRMREFITLDGFTLNEIVDQAVGSHRYRITARTEGGHSFSAFGKANAIHALSSLIDILYSVELPHEGNSRTTYNVGTISGGTSVNSIAQEAEMLFEYRSDHLACLSYMERFFHAVLQNFHREGVVLEVEQVGERPCGAVDPAAQAALLVRAKAAVRAGTGRVPYCRSGSTDANLPLSLGIPSLCLAACQGRLWHTRNETLELRSLLPGCRTFLHFLIDLF